MGESPRTAENEEHRSGGAAREERRSTSRTSGVSSRPQGPAVRSALPTSQPPVEDDGRAARPSLRILVVQETDWIARNPILHHRMLEAMAKGGDEVLVLDHDILWNRKGRRPFIQRRIEARDVTKFEAGSGLVVVRPAMLRVPGFARPTWLIASTLELLRTFRHRRPDVVVAYGLSNALVARLLAAAYGVPFVFHIFDVLHALAEPQALAPVARLVEATLLRSADAVVVGHRGMWPYVRRFGVRPSRMRYIPNGFERRPVDPARTRRVRERLGVSDDEVMLLFIGWLYDHSGLLEVARKLTADDRFAGYRLVIAGDGDLLEKLTAIAGSERGDRLVVLGRRPVSEMPELISASDVGLSVSDPDAAPMRLVVPAKVDEYLELGRPVVATRLPGMLSELGACDAMIWVDRADQALEAVAVAAAAADGGDPRRALGRLGEGGATYSASRPSWQAVTARFRALLVDEARR
jgi:glycosyltransferase involved in cell wall biosynthesis